MTSPRIVLPPYYTSAVIATRLVKRFQLQEYPISPDETLLLLRTIQPVTQVDELLRKSELIPVTVDISGAGGNYLVFHTVPAGKRWRLQWIDKDATTGASALRIYMADGTTAIDVILSGTAHAVVDMGGKVLDEGWTIRMKETNNGGDTAISMSAWIEESDAY